MRKRENRDFRNKTASAGHYAIAGVCRRAGEFGALARMGGLGHFC